MAYLRKRRRTNQHATILRHGTVRRLARRHSVEPLEQRILLAAVVSESPLANSHTAETSTDVSATFDEVITNATSQTFSVKSRQDGIADGLITVSGQVVTLDPTSSFFPGDVVEVTATSGIQGTTTTVPQVWQFRTAVSASGAAQFVDSGQNLGITAARDIEFGDLDGDGDLDSVESGEYSISIWLNDGTGIFTNNQLISGNNQEHELGDVDGDGDLDIVSTNGVFLNNGSGTFSDAGQTVGGFFRAIGMGDVDGDGDLDVIRGVPYGGDRVWLNDGAGVFTDSGQTLGFATSDSIQLGDLDSDGDLDAFTVYYGADNRVWVNDGSGVFTDSGQAIGGFSASKDVDIGDLDGDGDLDAFIANDASTNIPSQVWLNDGIGVFTDTGQAMGATENNWSLELGDLDGDGDLDAFVSVLQSSSRVWLNDGAARFTDSGQSIMPATRETIHVALGDVDGDGDLDAWEANNSQISRLMINENPNPSVTLAIDNPTISEAGGVANVMASLSASHNVPVTVELGIGGTATATEDYTVSATQIVIPVGATAGSMTITAVQDTVDEPDETVSIDIASVTNGQEAGAQQVTATIQDDDDPVIPDVTLEVDMEQIPEAGGMASFTAVLSESTTAPVAIDLAVAASSTATQTNDYLLSSSQIVIPPGNTTGVVTVMAVQDTVHEPPETIVLEVIAVNGGNEAGEQTAMTTIIDDDAPPTFLVSELTSTSSGFVAALSAEVDASVLNLFDTESGEHGPADVVVRGATTGQVTGSVVAGPRTLRFITTGERLAPDTYTVTLRSADNGIKDAAGNLLDGDADGTAGGDYIESFTIAPSAAVEIGIPDFMRGPGQSVQVPHGSAGLPLMISEGAGVRNVTVSVEFDASLLSITGATLGSNMPPGATVNIDTATPGRATISLSSPIDLPPGGQTIVDLQASVPTADAATIYREQQVLDVTVDALTGGDGAPVTAIDNDAVHVVAFMADTSGNGRINATDASQTARVAAFLDSGLVSFLTVDPLIIADVSLNGRINAADASQVAQVAALITVPGIPPIPPDVIVTAAGRAAREMTLSATFLPGAAQSSKGGGATSRLQALPRLTGVLSIPFSYAAVDVLMTNLVGLTDDDGDESEMSHVLEALIDSSTTGLEWPAG